MTNKISIDIADVRHAIGHKDFTVFVPANRNSSEDNTTKSIAEYFAADCEARKTSSNDKAPAIALASANEQIDLVIKDAKSGDHLAGTDSPPESKPNTSRSCMCLAYQGRYISATFRAGKRLEGLPSKGWKQPSQLEWRPFEKDPDNKIQTGDVVNYIRLRLERYDKVLNPEHPKGVIVVAGGTKSGKSEIARCLALSIIAEMVKKDQDLRNKNAKASTRVPHLVTCEDPIEAWELQDKTRIDKEPGPSLERGFNFTPREVDKDVASLAAALRDAKRQTPACFYVGEVRNSTDWIELLDFAGSGHLAIVTTHAASTVDAIVRILAAVKATTPSDRRQYVSNIAAVIHPVLSKNFLLPSMWIGTSAAVNSLVSDGPSAAMANDAYSLSRHQFSSKMNVKTVDPEVLKAAMELDLQELQRP